MDMLNTILGQFSPQITSQISKLVGESEAGTKSAVGAAAPAILGSLVGKASAPGGGEEVMNLLKQAENSGSLSDSANGALSKAGGGEGLSQPVGVGGGSSLLSSILGSRLGGTVDYISKASGIKSGSAASILGVVAPLVMGVLHKQVTSQKLDGAGVGALLASQAKHLKDAMPAGLADAVGVGNVLKAPESPAELATPAASATREIPKPAAAGKKGGGLLWLLVALVALVVYFTYSKSHHVKPGQPIAESSGSQVQPAAPETMESVKLPNGQELRLASGSVADKLAKAASGGNFDQSFSFEGLSFDSAGNLSSQSKGQIQELASVLKGLPDLSVTITGAGATQEAGLSQADSIKSALVSAGISPDRIKTGGAVGKEPPKLSAQR